MQIGWTLKHEMLMNCFPINDEYYIFIYENMVYLTNKLKIILAMVEVDYPKNSFDVPQYLIPQFVDG